MTLAGKRSRTDCNHAPMMKRQKCATDAEQLRCTLLHCKLAGALDKIQALEHEVCDLRSSQFETKVDYQDLIAVSTENNRLRHELDHWRSLAEMQCRESDEMYISSDEQDIDQLTEVLASNRHLSLHKPHN